MSMDSMRHQDECLCNSELITHSHQTALKDWIQRMWLSLVDFMIRPSEVCVWQSRDRQGAECWHAYDPTTGQRITRLSAAEMIDWIEHSYYR